MTSNTVPLIPDATGDARGDFLLALASVSAWIETGPGVPLPGDAGRIHMQVLVPAGPHARRLAALDEIAARIGAHVAPGRHGVLHARREFGPVTYGACLVPQGSGHVLAAMEDYALTARGGDRP